jgi:hypothetical protein
MPWLQPFQDPSLAELAARSSISGGGGVSSALLRPIPNQWLEALNQVAPVIREYIQKKKSDEIANQLMNMQQPPRAEAVDYPQGIPATDPFTGGADQMQVNQAYQAYLDKQQEEAQQSRLTEAKIKNLNEPGRNGVQRYPVRLPDGRSIDVTGNEALRHYSRSIKKDDLADVEAISGKKWSEWNQLAEHDLARISTDDVGNIVGEFQAGKDKDGNPIYERRSMPVELFTQARERYRQSHGQSPESNAPAMAEPQAETRYDSPPTIRTKEERDALPSGTVYIGPDGKKHRKP